MWPIGPGAQLRGAHPVQVRQTLIRQGAEQGDLRVNSGAGVTWGSLSGSNECKELVQVCGAWAVSSGWLWLRFCELGSSLSDGCFVSEWLFWGHVNGAQLPHR